MALNEFMAWFQQAPRPGFTKATVSAWRVAGHVPGFIVEPQRLVVPIAPAPVVVAAPAYIPPCPGPGYVWIGGNWIFGGGPVVRQGYFHAPIDHGRDFRRR